MLKIKLILLIAFIAVSVSGQTISRKWYWDLQDVGGGGSDGWKLMNWYDWDFDEPEWDGTASGGAFYSAQTNVTWDTANSRLTHDNTSIAIVTIDSIYIDEQFGTAVADSFYFQNGDSIKIVVETSNDNGMLTKCTSNSQNNDDQQQHYDYTALGNGTDTHLGVMSVTSRWHTKFTFLLLTNTAYIESIQIWKKEN
jgi:hypothetical protein